MDTAVVRGVPLALHPPGDYVSDVIRQSGDFYESPILDEIARRVSAGTVIDVGAMIGNHSAFFGAFLPDVTVHAFEPSEANLTLLLINTMPYPVVVHPFAASDCERRLRLLVDDDNRGHTRVDPAGRLVSNAMPIDAFGFEDVALIKIDVEGHEQAVLDGARETIDRWHPLIVLEDWSGAPKIPGYELVAEWEQAHQTFMYA